MSVLPIHVLARKERASAPLGYPFSIELPNYSPGGLGSCDVYGPVPLATFPDYLYCLRIGKPDRSGHVDPRPPWCHGPVAYLELLGNSERADEIDEFFHLV